MANKTFHRLRVLQRRGDKKVKDQIRNKQSGTTHPALKTDVIVYRILTRIPLNQQFSAQVICRQWKECALHAISFTTEVVISETASQYFWCVNGCSEHPDNHFCHSKDKQRDCLICHEFDDLDYWKKILPLMPRIECLYFDVDHNKNDEEQLGYWSTYSKLLRVMLESWKRTLICLNMPSHYQVVDFDFPFCDYLPKLQHFTCRRTSASGMKNLILAAPYLKYIHATSSFCKWEILPKGFRILKTYEGKMDGLTNVLMSSAATTIEDLDDFRITNEMCFKPFSMPKLTSIRLLIEADTNGSLRNLSRILMFAPNVESLVIVISCKDDIDKGMWTNVLSNCKEITFLKLDLLKYDDPKIKVIQWQDEFAEAASKNLKKLKEIDITFHLSSKGLPLMASLENCERFDHEIYCDNLKYNGVFDTEALITFLRSIFSKKLTYYRCYIPSISPFGEYLILDESFIKSYKSMEDELNLRFFVEQEDRNYDNEQEAPPKLPGKIYVTNLWARKRTEDDVKELQEERDLEFFEEEMNKLRVDPLFYDIEIEVTEEKKRERERRRKYPEEPELDEVYSAFLDFVHTLFGEEDC
jgi:hypothetical protein